MYLKVVYNILLSYLHESTCMNVGAGDARALRKTIITAITFTILNICLSNLRYRCIGKLSTICYCHICMKAHACMSVRVMHVH